MVLLTRNMCKEAHVIKSRGALGTGFTYAPVLEAGGKPSTWFPPERLVELTSHARDMGMLSDIFPMKILKFSKNLKNIIFLKFHRETAVTFDLTLIEQIDK